MALPPAISPVEAKIVPLPMGETRCALRGWAGNAKDQPIAVRAAPRADARVRGLLPRASAPGVQFPVHFSIVGARNGWLKIAHSSDARNGRYARPVFGGVGWIDGTAATLRIQSDQGYAKPDTRSEKLLDLHGQWLSDRGWVVAVVGCSGQWVLADYRLFIPAGLVARLPRFPERAWFQGTCGLAGARCPMSPSADTTRGGADAPPIPTHL